MIEKLNPIRAKNTHYFKAWNEDYKMGGIYHKLDNSEFRTIVILQANADNDGFVKKATGKGYSMIELGSMVGINFRTLKNTMSNLCNKEIISIDDDIVIRLNNFITDNIYREKSFDSSATRQRQINAIKINDNTRTLKEIEKKLNKVGK